MRPEGDGPRVEPGAPEPPSDVSRGEPAKPSATRTPWWRGLAVLGLLAVMVVLVLAATAALSPGPPQVTMFVFPMPPLGCPRTAQGYAYSIDAELSNDGGPARVTLRAYMDGAPALINGTDETITAYVSGPEGSGYADFTIYAPDCSWHAITVDIVSVVPA